MLDLHLGSSAHLTAWLVLIGAVAALGCGVWLRPGWLAVIVMVALAAVTAHELRTHARRINGSAWVRIQAGADGQWTLTRRDGRTEGGYALDPSRSFCQPWLVILALRRGWRVRYLPLPADALAPAQHRALRLKLRAPASAP